MLLIDLDMTGTDLAQTVRGSVWRHDVWVVQEGTGERRSDANLADIISRRFMVDGAIPELATEASAGGQHLLVQEGRVNVIGSRFDHVALRQPRTPAQLFNELSSLLLARFLHGLTMEFGRFAGSIGSRRCAVVVDNSPGYVGGAPVVEEWLSDLGPACGKFLFVSSLDLQDVSACNESLRAIARSIQRRWRISELLGERLGASAAGSEGELAELHALNTDGFFERLVAFSMISTTGKPHSTSEAATYIPLSFYLGASRDRGARSTVSDSGCYEAVLFNLLPAYAEARVRGSSVQETRAMLRAVGNGETNELAPIEKLLGESDADAQVRFIGYDPALGDQFSLRFPLMRREARRVELGKAFHVVRKRFQVAVRRPRSIQDGGIRELQSAADLAERARDLLAMHGFAYAYSVVSPAWMPSEVMGLLRRLSISLLPELATTSPSPLGRYTKDAEEQIGDRARKLSKYLGKHLPGGHGAAERQNMVWSVSVALGMAVEIAAHEGIPFNDRRIQQTALGIASEQIRCYFDEQFESMHTRLPAFYARLARMTQDRTLQLESATEGQRDAFRICSLAQSRILALRHDFDFLLDVLLGLSELNEGDAKYATHIRSITDEVLLERTVGLEEGREELRSSLVRGLQQRQIQAALEKTLARWGIGESR